MTPKTAAAKPIVSAEETSALLQGMQEASFPELQPKALAVVTPAGREIAGIQAEMGGFTGTEELTMADMVVPRYKIVQFMSRKGDAGNFYKTLTDEQTPAIDAIVVRVQKGRSMWEKGNFEAPVCRSLDFFNPDPRIEKPQNAICCMPDGTQVCPKGKWEGKTRPPCGMTYNLLCIDREDLMPFWLSVHGKSIEPVKRLNTTAMMRGKGKYYIFNVTFTLELQVNEEGKFYVLKISPPASRYERDTVTPLDPDSELEYMEIIRMCWNASLQRTFDAEEEARREAAGECPTEDVPHDQAVPGAPDWMNQK
jgi:hypothetical protein